MECASCGFVNPAGMRFCGQCASPLDAGPAPRGSGTAEVPAVEAERRQITVLFCDLVGSTGLAERLDPEDLRDVLGLYQEAATGEVEAAGGRVAQHLGDGLLVYFGYPRAQEDAAAAAVRAALGVLGAVDRLNHRHRRAWGFPLAVRVGVHTGLTVVGGVGKGERQEQLALGVTPNVAARLQGLAEPGSVVISAAVRRLLDDAFQLEPLGEREIAGLSRPLALFRVSGERETRRRGEAPPLPLVDRKPELGVLEARWREALEGRGSGVLISGDAGVGKSRLLEALRQRVEDAQPRWLECWCAPHYRGSALRPLTGLLARALRISPEEPGGTKLARLEARLETSGLPLEEAVPLLAALLSIPTGQRYPALRVSPQLRRERTLELLLDWVFRLLAERPLVFVLEDLHWSDPSTLEWIGRLLARAPAAPLLVVLTARPDFEPPWEGLPRLEHLPLGRLERHHCSELVGRLDVGGRLGPEVVEQLLEKTDGIPLYVEEVTRMVLEGSGGAGSPGRDLAIPDTLQDSLMSRLDRLGPVRRLARWASPLGKMVSRALLEAVVPLAPEELERQLEALVASGILVEQAGSPPGIARYRFKHALIQQTAYRSLLRRERRNYHGKIADALLERFPETVAIQPELLAHHLSEAGRAEAAIERWHEAARRALERSANREAAAHVERALELVGELPDAAEAADRELALRMTLGPALIASHGYAAPVVEETFARARELCTRQGSVRWLLPALRGLVPFYLVRAELGTADELGRELLVRATERGEEAMVLEAHVALTTSCYWRGAVAESLEHAERVEALYDPERHASHRLRYGQDSGVLARLYAAWCHWWLGRPETARALAREAVGWARRLDHPHTLVMALDHACVLAQYLRDRGTAGTLVDELERLATEHGFPMWAAMATYRRGWALGPDDPEEGLRLIETGLDAFHATGARLARPFHLGHLAEALARLGRFEAGLEALDQAERAVEEGGERYHEADIHRLRGELLEQAGEATAAGGPLRRALELTAQQGARSLELRAATSLARHLLGGDRRGEARECLAPVYDRFEEGWETADLVAARRLLDELESVEEAR